uniref:TIL domain-containing protein n=1 Tax=Meloidogyne hapla TaxID=6305 RepID=A0A1I8BF13_MELHA
MFILQILFYFIIAVIIRGDEEYAADELEDDFGVCGEHKELDTCYMRCLGYPPSCEYPRGLDIMEETKGIECVCEEACVCEDGYVRKDWRVLSPCVSIFECPKNERVI